MLPANQDHPPMQPARPRVQLEATGMGLSLRYRQRQWGTGLFMMFWLCGWTVGCVFLAYTVWTKPEPMMLVFAVPFWASWFFAATLLLTMFLQLEELILDDNGVSYTKSIILPMHQRSIPLEELVEFVASQTMRTSDEDVVTSYVELRSLGRPLLMLPNLSDVERRWLTWRLNQQLQALNPSAIREDREPSALHSHTEPPSDSLWTCDASYEGSTFILRGRFSLVALLGALFINLFWNGIVSVFVMVLFGVGPDGPALFEPLWWGMFLFLLPFEAIGLVMIVAFIAVLLEPVHTTTWHFGRDEITLRDAWLGVGRTRRYDPSSIARIHLNIMTGAVTPKKLPSVKSFQQATRTSASQDCQLRLIDRDNVEVVSLTGLTEGEARWMMATLEREHPAWFR